MRRSATLRGVLALGAKTLGALTLGALTLGARTLGALTLATIGVANAQGKIRLAQTSTVTNCMMACNSQAAACQTTCLIPGTAPTGAATTTSNANLSTSCQANCSTQQISCQTTCAQNSPSQ
ncbi:MAG: hypothetical protein WAM40_22585 [Xanthobacteraceae bacterium]